MSAGIGSAVRRGGLAALARTASRSTGTYGPSVCGAEATHARRCVRSRTTECEAIDASIASHSVVLDLTHRRAWVASAPHTLGPYVPVDLEAVLASAASPPLRTAEPIPADIGLTDGSYVRYLSAREALASARRLEHDRKKGWLKATARDAQRAHELAPEFAEAAAKLGELEARAVS